MTGDMVDSATEAIGQAKRLAAWRQSPYSVWRKGDKFCAIPEGDDPYDVEADGLWRPVAIYDADGTEHA
jgi:hypothetical protein